MAFPSFFLTGHRGCRGLYPENTIPGFLKTLEYPVNTLELDVVISADGEVVVSHEGWMHEEICLDPAGKEISALTAQSHNIYRMPYSEVLKYDCGLKNHPRFPFQTKMPCVKPLLKDVIREIEAVKKIVWDVELKSVPEEYGIFQPEPAEMVERVLKVLNEFDLSNGSAPDRSKGGELRSENSSSLFSRLIMRSFDYAPLKYLREHYPEIPLCLIVEDNDPVEKHFEKLGFIPFMYSPDFELVTEHSIQYVHANNCTIVPWTVNELSDMKRLKAMGVDGLITDYPDKFNVVS